MTATETPAVEPNDVPDVLDTLIRIFQLDDDPGKLIRAHYVTTDAERLRWLGALRRIGSLLGDAGAIDTCLHCHERPASMENLCGGCYDATVDLELSCDWLPDEEATQ